jgi:hypothetical protein
MNGRSWLVLRHSVLHACGALTVLMVVVVVVVVVVVMSPAEPHEIP